MISQGLLRSIQAHAADRLGKYELWCRSGRVGPRHVEFHRSSHRRRLVRAGNQVGKSLLGAAELWWHARGHHPFKEVPTCERIWVVVADLENHYPTICSKMHEVEPGYDLDPKVSYTPERGYRVSGRRAVLVKNRKTGRNCLIEFRSGKGEVTALASGTIDALWIDEPPQESHWSEALSRVSVKQGPVWATLTPVGRPCAWLRHHVEGDPEKGTPPAEDWEQTVIRLSVEDCPHRSQESIDEQVASYLPDERPQRTSGDWEGVTPDRYLDAWNDTLELNYPPGMPLWELMVSNGWRGEREDVRIGIAGDHGEQRAGANVWGLGCYDERTGEAWLLDEWASDGAVDEHQVAEQLRAMLERSGLTFNAVDRARGDTNTPGFGHVRRLNTVLTQAVAQLAGCPPHKPPFTIRDASKGPGSVRSGLRAINVGCTRRVFRVTSRCRRTLAALRHFKGPGVAKTLHHKDPLDMVRYLFVSPGFLLDRYRPTGTPLMGH